MSSNYINQIAVALQSLVLFSYKAHFKSSTGFEFEDERNGYESEQFTEQIQAECGVQFWRATTERYGGDYTLHYKMSFWLKELFIKYDLPLTFTSCCENKDGTDQAYITDTNVINNKIIYYEDRLKQLNEEDLLDITNKLASQLTFLSIKYKN